MTDPGQPIERTRLSWRRTWLSALAIPLLAVSRIAIGSPTTPRLIGVSFLALAWCAIAAVARPRMAALRRGHSTSVGLAPVHLALLVTAYAAASALLVL